jgi:hypothetical protein
LAAADFVATVLAATVIGFQSIVHPQADQGNLGFRRAIRQILSKIMPAALAIAPHAAG